MSKHDDDTCPHLVRASLLEAENARLKTEVQHLMIFCNSTLIPSKELQAENARLKTELARLRASSFVTAVPVEQYERVVKAGDAMVLKVPDVMAGVVKAEEAIGLMNDWIAAKEGKPSV